MFACFIAASVWLVILSCSVYLREPRTKTPVVVSEFILSTAALAVAFFGYWFASTQMLRMVCGIITGQLILITVVLDSLMHLRAKRREAHVHGGNSRIILLVAAIVALLELTGIQAVLLKMPRRAESTHRPTSLDSSLSRAPKIRGISNQDQGELGPLHSIRAKGTATQNSGSRENR